MPSFLLNRARGPRDTSVKPTTMYIHSSGTVNVSIVPIRPPMSARAASVGVMFHSILSAFLNFRSVMIHKPIELTRVVPMAICGGRPVAIIKGVIISPPDPPIAPTMPVVRLTVNNIAI